MDWTVCPPSASGVCPPGMKLAMINRGGATASPTSCQISFSSDSKTWGPQTTTDNGQIVVGTHHGKPGLVAVPGALLSSQQISACPLGLKLNPDQSCGTPGAANHTKRKPSDVIGHGMALLISKDGVRWSLFKKLWPFGGMYTTLAALTTNKAGEALTYGVIFSAGNADGGEGSTGTVTVRARRGRLSALRVLHRKSVLYGGFVCTRRALNNQNRRFPARAARRHQGSSSPSKVVSNYIRGSG